MAQILVVDDEVGIRELLSEILADEGHQVMLAESAGEARRLRERARPDLVLLDIWMPDTDGITLLKEWAASGQLTMPVVMMSGHGTIETAVEATRIGALDFLEKPIALQRLLATVKRALRNPEAAAPPQLSLGALGRSTRARRREEAPGAARAARARRCCCAASAACAPSCSRACSPAPGAPFLAGGEHAGASRPPSCSARRPAASCSSPTCRASAAPSSATSSSCWRARRSTSVRVVSFSPLDVRTPGGEARVRSRARRAPGRADAPAARAARLRRGRARPRLAHARAAGRGARLPAAAPRRSRR